MTDETPVESAEPVAKEGPGAGGEGAERAKEDIDENQVEKEHTVDEQIDVEHVEGEYVDGEQVEGEYVEGEHVDGEHVEGEGKEQNVMREGEELMGEELEGEGLEGEQVEGEEKKVEQKAAEEEKVEEEETYVEPPPPDPAAPYDFSDSNEALKPPFQLRPDQIAEVEQLWESYQNHTPAYSDIDGYITEKELIYMLKCLFLMTYTPEQLQELIEYCVRPPHPEGHITYDQFLKMITLRQRDFPIEDELRSALQVFDKENSGSVNREVLIETLLKQGHKMPQKQLNNLIKEVDMSNDGTIGIEDVIGTMCIDLNKEDLLMLMASLNPEGNEQPQEELE